jgi:HAMP domain-containing protein
VRSVASVAVALLLLASPAAAGAASFLPPAGKVYWGGQGGYTQAHIRDFAEQSGKHPAVFNYFISWRASESSFHWLSYRLADARAEGTAAMLSVAPEDTGLTPRDLAQGRGDAFLVGLNRLLAEHGQVTFLRPLSEMNNANNSYAPYDLSGRSRGPANSVGELKNAWRRVALIARGGEVAAMDAKLRRLHMPPVRTAAPELPRSAVALMWVPLSFGNPEIPKNHPSHFWPGSEYVDWVGTTWYSPFKASSAMQSFYSYPLWRTKPFAFAEWGVWGRDDPAFVRQFFGFVKTHPRVRMAVYYQSALLKPEFRLSAHPSSRAVLRQAIRWPRLTGVAP